MSHPDVAEAAVIAAKHPRWDERPLLLVVPKPGHEPDPEDLRAWYQGRVAPWSAPDAALIVDGAAAHRHRQAAQDGIARAVRRLLSPHYLDACWRQSGEMP